jgi:hypothetical protein
MPANYGQGYQDALQDVLDKWNAEGAEAALKYIRDNLAAGRVVK